MYLGVGAHALYLMLTGGFLAAGGAAMRRQDGGSLLAMAVAAVISAHLGGLPSAALVWACTIVAVGMIVSIVAVGHQLVTGGRPAFMTGLVGTAVVLATLALSGPTTASGMTRPVAIGMNLHERIEALIAE